MAKKLGKSQTFKDIYLAYSRYFLGFSRGYLGNSNQVKRVWKIDIISLRGPPPKKKSSPQNGKNIFYFALKKKFWKFVFVGKSYLAYSRYHLGFSSGYLGNSNQVKKVWKIDIISPLRAPLKPPWSCCFLIFSPGPLGTFSSCLGSDTPLGAPYNTAKRKPSQPILYI